MMRYHERSNVHDLPAYPGTLSLATTLMPERGIRSHKGIGRY